jgi:hypothetical protein
VRPAGSLAAIASISGPPLLRDAAVSAAKQARFECRGCAGDVVRCSLYVTYRLWPHDQREVRHRPPLVVSPTQGWMTVDGHIQPMHIHFATMSVRAPTCLYLWRCGSEWGGMRYWHEPVRAGRCAWLWKCGWSKPRTET